MEIDETLLDDRFIGRLYAVKFSSNSIQPVRQYSNQKFWVKMSLIPNASNGSYSSHTVEKANKAKITIENFYTNFLQQQSEREERLKLCEQTIGEYEIFINSPMTTQSIIQSSLQLRPRFGPLFASFKYINLKKVARNYLV